MKVKDLLRMDNDISRELKRITLDMKPKNKNTKTQVGELNRNCHHHPFNFDILSRCLCLFYPTLPTPAYSFCLPIPSSSHTYPLSLSVSYQLLHPSSIEMPSILEPSYILNQAVFPGDLLLAYNDIVSLLLLVKSAPDSSYPRASSIIVKEIELNVPDEPDSWTISWPHTYHVKDGNSGDFDFDDDGSDDNDDSDDDGFDTSSAEFSFITEYDSGSGESVLVDPRTTLDEMLVSMAPADFSACNAYRDVNVIVNLLGRYVPLSISVIQLVGPG